MGITRHTCYCTRNPCTKTRPDGKFVLYEDHLKEMKERVLHAYIKGQIDGAFEQRQQR